MKRYLLLLLLAIMATLDGFAQAQLSGQALFGGLRARQIGPAVMSGRVSTFDVVNSRPEIIYVGAASGGVWKSLSGGTVFRPIFDDHCQSIGKIAIDQRRPDTVWVGTGETWVRNSVSVGNGIYKSTNGGVSWTHLGLEKTERIGDILIHPDKPDIVFVGALGPLWNAAPDRGVYKTDDGGKTWEKVLYIDENTGCASLAMDPENPDILYAAMWGFRRWPWFFNSGLGGKSGLYKSVDGGKTWRTIHQGLPDETLGRIAVAAAPSNAQVLYASVECKSADKKGLYRSDDQGESWSKVSNEFNTTVRPFYFSRLVVDPRDEQIVMKCGLYLIISEDGGARFRTMDQSVHADIHDIWINPNNTKHVLIGTDGGMYESFDRGFSFRMWMNLPLSQFYHVSVDDDIPYNVYGGLQDNGSWYGPSRKAGGITNADWHNSYGGDGFYSFRHPTDKDIIFSEYQGGNLVRYNRKTGTAKDIKPYPAGEESKYRFNWNSPVHISPNNGDRMYFGAQYLFVTNDRGDSWTRISPDLTTNNPDKLRQHESGGLTLDNSTAENHCTIYAIAESPQDELVVWVGTDDGNLQVSADGGKTWRNVVANAPDLPANTWVTFIEPGHFDRKTAYVAFDGHRTGDMETYLYHTNDLGQTWRRLPTASVEGYALCVREDLKNPNLLFLGTELGLYISVDGGENWHRFTNNLPKVAIRDMVIHPRDHDLVLGTHGRGVIIIDDITPLRRITSEIVGQPLVFLDLAPTVLRDPGGGGAWFGGSANFVGPNPSSAAKIAYYMNKRHTFGKMELEVYHNGELIKTLPAGKSAGINIVEMPTSLKKPKAPPTNNRMALFGTLFGPNLAAGDYEVRLVKGKDTYATTFSLINDPHSIYSDADRAIQRQTTMRLYQITENMAYWYEALGKAHKQAEAIQGLKKSQQAQLEKFANKIAGEMDKMVATGGDGYVAEEERLYERISDLYRLVSSYPGPPSESQLRRTAMLAEEAAAAERRAQTLLNAELAAINLVLAKAGRPEIQLPSREDFFAEDDAVSGADRGGRWFFSRAEAKTATLPDWQWLTRGFLTR
jgi:photosystem II stability/assembly factor-like uncharacterized protein